MKSIEVRICSGTDRGLASAVSEMITGLSQDSEIAARDTNWVAEKMAAGHAVIALNEDQPIGFGAIHVWVEADRETEWVSHSGICVVPAYQGQGLSDLIIDGLVNASMGEATTRKRLDFVLTTHPKIRHSYTARGFTVAPLCTLTSRPDFWDGCRGCRLFNVCNEPDATQGHDTPVPNFRCCCEGLSKPQQP